MAINFNTEPYYDDFDEGKKFYRILYRPSYAVQARELTQMQTILQNQISRFGDHVFKNGSLVTGGELFVHNSTYLKVDNDYSGVTVQVSQFDGKTITDATGLKRGEVVVVYDADAGTGDPKTVFVKQA